MVLTADPVGSATAGPASLVAARSGAGPARRRDAGFAGQDNLVAGWVPGQSPVIFPESSGVRMHKGDALVMQLHYHYATAPTPDASGLALQLDEPSSAFKELRVVNPLGPVEIPCAPADADEPLCDREASLADNVEKYGPSGAGNEAGLLMLCRQTPEELTKDFDGNVARSSCVSRVPQDGQIVGVLGPHAHARQVVPPHLVARHRPTSRSCSTSPSGASTGR